MKATPPDDQPTDKIPAARTSRARRRIAVFVSPELLARIDAIAERENRSRSMMMAIMLDRAAAFYESRLAAMVGTVGR
jgi:hypothetical protein